MTATSSTRGGTSPGGTATTDEIRTLVPHAGGMCLLERLIEWDVERIVLATATHRAPDNPLRRDGRLHAVHLCEYGAQAMAVHGGLKARAEGRSATPGVLVSLREVQFEVERVDDLAGEITVVGERLLEGNGSWQYAFTVSHSGRLLARGRAAVVAAR